VKKKIVIIYGTRPEVIKLCVLIKTLSKSYDVKTVFTNQHTSLYETVKKLVPIPDYTLNIRNENGLNVFISYALKDLQYILNKENPNLVIVQGDTASAYSGSLASFNLGIPVGHVEAGLRTYNMQSPFPEELYRQCISKIATLNWCPSNQAQTNLANENILNHTKTGNPIVDYIKNKIKKITQTNKVIITLHRRENKDKFKKILLNLRSLAWNYKEFKYIFPVHPNSIIREPAYEILQGTNVKLVEPIGYDSFLKLISSCAFIITDSGGLQEEAVTLKKKLILCRDTTERPENLGINIKMVDDGLSYKDFEWAKTPIREKYKNPYGNGNSCQLIKQSIKDYFK
jgi:UDP-N-acetylglucosamine 2-epimerase (non-hydrolysing)